jgi:hypothetical protein
VVCRLLQEGLLIETAGGERLGGGRCVSAHTVTKTVFEFHKGGRFSNAATQKVLQ